ncbi:MAG: sigma-70 family RNA polymerase sigma factor [Acidobacteriota bacterium]
MDSSPSATSASTIAELLEKLEPRMKRILYRYRIPAQDSDDILQQTVLTMLRKQEQIEKPEPWLLATLKNRCIMYWRSRRSQLYDTVDASILELAAQPGHLTQERREMSRDLERALAKLPGRCQKALHLRYVLGMKPREVADALGYQRSSIRKITNRCLAALTKQLLVAGHPMALRQAEALRTQRREAAGDAAAEEE